MNNTLHHPNELQYTARHIWCRREGTFLIAGITDFAQQQLGEILFIDLPDEGSHLEADAVFGTVESLKSVSSLYMPVSGEIMEINTLLAEDPTLANRDCYGAGWMIRIQPDKEQKLMDATDYLALTN